ncbi:MAG: twin-arginine translocase subunit TatC [Vicinamibacterales bacterium]
MALVPFPGKQSGALALPADDDELESESPGGRMSFLEHLDEFRKRIVHSCLYIAGGVIVGFFFIDHIFNFLMAPARATLPLGATMIYTQPGEAFNLYITVSLIAGVLIASPFVMMQVWLFIAPGLYSKEKMLAIPFVIFSTIGLVGGAAFNHYVAFPFIMAFFGSFNSADLRFMPRLDDVFGLYTKMLIGIALVFQMPTVVFFLAKMRMVTARFLVRNFKYAILLIFVAAAVITPTGDPMTQAIFAAPMLGLYLFSIVVAWLVGPKRVVADA